MNQLLAIALRQNAVFVPKIALATAHSTLNNTTSVLCANAAKLGFTFDETLLHALNGVSPNYKITVLEFLKQVAGVDKNWTPLVKGWDVPTNVTIYDHLITLFHHLKGGKTGTTMPCSHVIPDGTFPLERYNGCPFCGTPFEFGKIEKMGQGSKLAVLKLWSEDEVQAFFHDLLQSKTALDATQVDSLKTLLTIFPLPENVVIGMKETMVLVVDALLEKGEGVKASVCFTSPTDILRYLWFKHTGFLQIIEPKVLEKRLSKNAIMDPRYTFAANRGLQTKAQHAAKTEIKSKLDLKYDRKMCLVVATWLNALIENTTGNTEAAAEKTAEIMHPKRAMWVRFIRALRLAEYSKRKGMEPLARLLDVFYNQTYTVWEGRVSHFRLRSDADATFALLKQRPGAFARCLFANMLWFGDAETIAAFSEVSPAVPLRLLFTLNMYAENYFTKQHQRAVKPLGGINKVIPAHPLLGLYDDAQLQKMQERVTEMCLATAQKHFASQEAKHKKMFIAPLLYNMPIAIGDRSEAIQDRPVALMGTRFPVQGDQIRLFLQWGNGLSAQHLDMDLSCQIAYPNGTDYCSYSHLTTTGCQHGGDIQQIPEKVGTAEYININLAELQKAGAKYVTFTCNAFTSGALSPNLVVGWMDSKFPMHISPKTGVAYDPSCVQHQVRITQTAAKGLVFGVLDVAAREVVWLEMTFSGQVVQNLDAKGVEALLAKLKSKMSIGSLLQLKAEAQNVALVEAIDADIIYDYDWAINAAAVTQTLLA